MMECNICGWGMSNPAQKDYEKLVEANVGDPCCVVVMKWASEKITCPCSAKHTLCGGYMIDELFNLLES